VCAFRCHDNIDRRWRPTSFVERFNAIPRIFLAPPTRLRFEEFPRALSTIREIMTILALAASCLQRAGYGIAATRLGGINGLCRPTGVSDERSFSALLSAIRTFEKPLRFSARAIGKGSE
jgi:hypothetical protein